MNNFDNIYMNNNLPNPYYTSPDYVQHQVGDSQYVFSNPQTVGGSGSFTTGSGQPGVYVIKSPWGPCEYTLITCTFTTGGTAFLLIDGNPVSATNNFNTSLQLMDEANMVVMAGGNNTTIPLGLDVWYPIDSNIQFVVKSSAVAFLTYVLRRPRHIRQNMPPNLMAADLTRHDEIAQQTHDHELNRVLKYFGT